MEVSHYTALELAALLQGGSRDSSCMSMSRRASGATFCWRSCGGRRAGAGRAQCQASGSLDRCSDRIWRWAALNRDPGCYLLPGTCFRVYACNGSGNG